MPPCSKNTNTQQMPVIANQTGPHNGDLSGQKPYESACETEEGKGGTAPVTDTD